MAGNGGGAAALKLKVLHIYEHNEKGGTELVDHRMAAFICKKM